jgi:hypothetical protein
VNVLIKINKIPFYSQIIATIMKRLFEILYKKPSSVMEILNNLSYVNTNELTNEKAMLLAEIKNEI